jgi:hypothetical protein
MIYLISTQNMKNVTMFKEKLNELFVAYGAGYGSSLPASAADGRLFYLLPGNDPYQYRNGSWVAL